MITSINNLRAAFWESATFSAASLSSSQRKKVEKYVLCDNAASTEVLIRDVLIRYTDHLLAHYMAIFGGSDTIKFLSLLKAVIVKQHLATFVK